MKIGKVSNAYLPVPGLVKHYLRPKEGFIGMDEPPAPFPAVISHWIWGRPPPGCLLARVF